MFVLLYPFMILLSFFFVLLTFLLSPWLAWMADEDGNLPWWLKYFQTHDNTLDAGWKVQGNYGSYLKDGTVPTKLERYWYRICWLWRNPGYGFDYYLLGMEVDPSECRVIRASRTPRYEMSDQGPVQIGETQVFFAIGPNGHFCLFYVGFWGELKIGWKIRAYWDDVLEQWRPPDFHWGPLHRTSICGTYSPFKH